MKLARRKFLKAGAGSLALLAATGCDQLPHELKVCSLNQRETPRSNPRRSLHLILIHALNRAAFGPRPGEYERIRRLANTADNAAADYLEQQLTPERIDNRMANTPAAVLRLLSSLSANMRHQQDLLQHELMRATLARAVYSQRQLYEVMVEFWSDHFNIDPSKGDCKWLTVADDREVIRKTPIRQVS